MISWHGFGRTNFQVKILHASVQHLDDKLCNGKHDEEELMKVCLSYGYNSRNSTWHATFKFELSVADIAECTAKPRL